MYVRDATMVVHGPEVFDQGDVRSLMALLHPRTVLVAGVMARTAAEESGLPVLCCDDPPSIVIQRLTGPVFLVSRGKTVRSGRIFGEIVSARLGERGGLVHLECSSQTCYLWNHCDEALGSELALHTGYTIVRMQSTGAPSSGWRKIRGCLSGEAVCINGVVIGYATGDTVIIETKDGIIRPVAGLEPKEHGLEKLQRQGAIDLATAWCKSGAIRAAPPAPGERRHRNGRIVVIDHCGHTLFEWLDERTCGVLAIGDDTTAVCGHICSHYGIPVLGIVDGDADLLVPEGFAPGSVVLEVSGDRDDEVGWELAQEVPDSDIEWDTWVEHMKERLLGRAIIRLQT